MTEYAANPMMQGAYPPSMAMQQAARLPLYIYIYICAYVWLYVFVYIYIYIYTHINTQV